MHRDKRHTDKRSDRQILQDIEQFLSDAFEHLHNLLHTINQKENYIMSKIDDLNTAVSEESTVIDSTVTLLTNLTQMIKAAGTDPAKLDALMTSITANKTKLADAVVANTPAAEGGGSTGGV